MEHIIVEIYVDKCDALQGVQHDTSPRSPMVSGQSTTTVTWHHTNWYTQDTYYLRTYTVTVKTALKDTMVHNARVSTVHIYARVRHI